ncbi:putative nuclease HARBI1 isoform X1 [Ixodes scapularis]
MKCNASAPSRQTMDCTPIFQLYPVDRRNRSHRDAFELPEHAFRKQYRLAKTLVRWLCDELREEPELQRLRRSSTVVTVEDQVLCALRFYVTGSFQGMVASDEHIAQDQGTVSIALRAVSVAIVRCLGIQHGWIHFFQTASERDDFERGFQLLGRIPGVIGCIDGTMISIVGPSKYDPTVTKAAYWCTKQYYALNVMVVCDARCRVMCIDPCYPGSVHDSFAWRFSSLRDNFKQGRLIDDGRFLLGDSGYALEPWLITPVPGAHTTSTASGRFNKADFSMRSVVERCIGLLKSRFRCLQRHRALYYHPTTATAIIMACAVLHNICLASMEPEPEPDADSDSPESDSGSSSDGFEPGSAGLEPEMAGRFLPTFRSRRAKAVPSRGPLQAALAVPYASSGGATKESVVDLASLAVLPSREASDDREPLVVTVATMPAVPQGLRCREYPRPSSAPLVPWELPVEVRKTLSGPQARRFMNCAVS